MHLDVIAFGTHPDDVELFCGGTLIKLSRKGFNVGVIDLTRGELSSRGDVETRASEAQNAARLLQVRHRENLGLSDGDIHNTFENRQCIIERLRDYRPQLVLIPYARDRHPDHVRAAELLQEAVFYSGLARIVTGKDPFRPAQVVYYYHHEITEPTFVVDISETFAEKLAAVKAFRSQFYDPESDEPETYISSKAFFDSIEIRAAHFGFQIGVSYGEPFYCKQPFKPDNLMILFT
jgi:bacillithiol biosynthesis deacetylase BshB1